MLLLVFLCFLYPFTEALSADVVQCFETGECTLENVCGFNLPSGMDEGRCYKADCKNLTGHIMKIKSNLDFDVVFNWDVLGEHDATKSDWKHSNRLVHVPKYGVKYFDTGSLETHTVRLYVKREPVAIMKSTPVMCPSGFRTCQYLVRVCYDPEDSKTSESHLNATQEDPNLYSLSKYVPAKKCAEYSRHCHGFDIKETSQEKSCIFDCVSTFDPAVFEAIATQNLNNDKLKKCLVYASGGHVTTKAENAEPGSPKEDTKILTSSYWGYNGCGGCYHSNTDCDDKHSTLTAWLVGFVILSVILLAVSLFLAFKLYKGGWVTDDYGRTHTGRTTL